MTLLQDLRFGARRLRHTPLFTIAVVATLSTAIGANVAAFSAVKATLLRPLEIRQPERVVVVSETAVGTGQNVKEVSYRNFVDWRARSRSFDVMAAIGSTPWDFVLDRTDQLFRFKTAIVSASFFDLLGVSPQLGRLLVSSDDVRGAARVLVLSDPLWRQQFGGDPTVIGRQVVIGDQPFTVVGVMPSNFAYPVGVQAWTPVVPALASANARWKVDTLEARHFGLLTVVGRLAVDVSAQQAKTELDAIVRQLPDSEHRSTGSLAVSITPLLDEIFGPMRVGLILLFAMVGVVLLIACANVSSLVLARASALEHASAVRIALGARRLDLIRESVVEMAIVTSTAGVIGIFLALIALKPLLAMAPASLPRLEGAELDWLALIFTAGLCALTTLLCGLVPALQGLARGVETAGLRARTDDGPRRVIGRDLLTAAQIAFATLLVVGAALLVRSFDQLRRINLGFDSQRVLTVDVEPQALTASAYRLAYDAIIERVAALPGVEAVGAAYSRPLAAGRFGLDSGYLLEGQRLDRPDDWKGNAMLNAQAVTTGYFDAMRIPLRGGRFFSSHDSQDAPSVAIVSETTARRLWPGKDPIGQRLSVASGVTEKGEFPMQTVVGVVAEVRYRGIDDRRLDVYLPASQTQHRVKHLMIRSSGDPIAIAESVRAAVEEVATRTVIGTVSSMERIVAEAGAPWRFSMALMVGLAGLGLLLAVTGLFSLVAFSVARRRRELSVRLAIGASPASVIRLVLWQGMRSTIVGLSAGVVLSLAVANRMTPMLFQVPPSDALTFVAGTGLLGATAFLAGYLAARRVVAIDPLQVMRSL